ncbi:MAG: hypothetical protein OXM02_04670 [Bacteroidota bacterium]|nr:hypothetical protein [Bacteroidota bacterium]MDE2833796.1 hypothetical protein [Bacteroidota bacterium]
MKEISLKQVADGLDAMLDDLMIGQARITAHMVAAAEAADCRPSEIIAKVDGIADKTVLDELWITDGTGFAYLTNVLGEDGLPIPFRFLPDQEKQPQASAFCPLLDSETDADDYITQVAQVREISWDIYKYVGVSGVDRKRIVQVGNALAFEEQGLLANTYASPVMTAVLAAFGENDLLSQRFTSRVAEIREVFDSIMSRQLAVHASLVDALVSYAEQAGWTAEELRLRLQRIVKTSPMEAVDIVGTDREASVSSSPDSGGIRHAAVLTKVERDKWQAIDHMPVADDPLAEKSVTIFNPDTARFVQVTIALDANTLVSPHFSLG